MIKKLLLLIFIFPLVVFARPEKKYLTSPLWQLYGKVIWQNTANCLFSYTHGASWNTTSDNDCDDNTRTKYGTYNSTDVTCSDGSANDCDGAFHRIKFSKLLKGVYFFEPVSILIDSGWCNIRFLNVEKSVATNAFGSNYSLSNQATSAGLSYMMYENKVDQGESTFIVQVYDSATLCEVYNSAAETGPIEITVWYHPPLDSNTDGKLIFK